ncbi:MAG TPA: cytochrome b/b6 domain-containing protein [Burkholderiales bacterium]|nr:cytochrome b/b6 domain-containing protein [Burkholderiales bacterium]
MSNKRLPLYLRHAWPVRVTHWVNALALAVLFMSGLNIFSAHPALYWGKSSYTGRGPALQVTAREDGGEVVGVTRVFGREFVTTGVLGASAGPGGTVERTFPSWLTLPGERWLAMARRWHFSFAWLFVLNGLAYLAYAFASRHVARDLLPSAADWRGIGRSVLDHLRLRHPVGEAARRYNVLQKLTYLGVIFGLLPLVVLTGFAMSPSLDALVPGWVDLLGGRQSARTLHFLAAWLLVAFVLVHVVEMILAGPWNHLRSMVTGRYRVPAHPADEQAR